MKKQFTLMFVFVVLAVLVMHGVSLVKADTTIYIRPDGSVVGTNLIARNGDIYIFTANITAPIVIERNNIVLDGVGYTLEGHRVSDAINLTCSNTTIKNLRITDWSTGILGAYNNNTITGNLMDGCEYGIKIYEDKYIITENIITHNNEGIRLHGGSNVIANNNINGNKHGVFLQGYASYQGNIITGNTITNNELGIFLFANTFGTQQLIYLNNFIQNTAQVGNTGNRPDGTPLKNSEWNNDSKGNYWSDYNGTDTNGDGIGDVAYTIDVANSDKYPLMQPATKIDSSIIPKPSLTASPMPWPPQLPTVFPTSSPTSIQTPITSETPIPSSSSSQQSMPSIQPQTVTILPIEISSVLAASITINIVLVLVLIYHQRHAGNHN